MTIIELVDKYFLTIQKLSKTTSLRGDELNILVYVMAGCINYLQSEITVNGFTITDEEKNAIMVEQQQNIHKTLKDFVIKFDTN